MCSQTRRLLDHPPLEGEGRRERSERRRGGVGSCRSPTPARDSSLAALPRQGEGGQFAAQCKDIATAQEIA